MEYIMRIVKSLKESDLLIKGIGETVENESKEQKRGFLSMLLGTLGARLIRNLLAGKEATATSWGQGIIRAGKRKN